MKLVLIILIFSISTIFAMESSEEKLNVLVNHTLYSCSKTHWNCNSEIIPRIRLGYDNYSNRISYDACLIFNKVPYICWIQRDISDQERINEESF